MFEPGFKVEGSQAPDRGRSDCFTASANRRRKPVSDVYTQEMKNGF